MGLKLQQELSLKEAIGQMLVVRASGYLLDSQIRYPAWEPNYSVLEGWIKELNVGGVILLGASAPELWLRVQQLQEAAKIPLLIAADIEQGVGQRFAGATWFPPPMSLGSIAQENLTLAREWAHKFGAITASEALAVGINWLLAPVVDVNNNPDNPVINVRAFGENVEIVSDLATAFIAGAKLYPVLTTAKHFPGHGDTTVDSHLDLPILNHSEERLKALELLPFKRAIAAGVDSVMSAHLLISAWDNDRPATLSEAIIKGQLRQNLGFTGLVVTDALIMAGVAKYATPEEVAILAIEAGVDILLIPQAPEITIEAVYQAVRSGRLSEERIRKSLARIWQAKTKVISSSSDSSSFNKPAHLALPEATKCVDSILQASIQTGGTLPIKPSPHGGQNLILVHDATNCSDFLARHTAAIAIPKKLGYSPQLFDSRNFNFSPDNSQPTLVQLFIRGNPFQDGSGLTTIAKDFLQKLLKNNSLQALLIYGSPYVLTYLKPEINNLSWIFCYGQMPQAQSLVCSRLFGKSSLVNLNEEDFI